MEADFSGYATKAGIKCSDGRTITPDAFKHQDTLRVPLVWQHGHDKHDNVLGYAILEHRDSSHPEGAGIYAYGYFNETDAGKNAKKLVAHGDIVAMSIYANKLVEKTKSVLHGMIREVSLVLSGANPGALIDYVRLEHSDGDIVTLDDEAIIYSGLELSHTEVAPEEPEVADDEDEDDVSHADGDEETMQDVYDSFTDKQKDVVHFMIGAALEQAESSDDDTEEGGEAAQSDVDDDEDDKVEHSDDNDEDNLTHQEGNTDMSRNVFDNDSKDSGLPDGAVLSHDGLKAMVTKARDEKLNFKDLVLAHAAEYGVEDIDLLFPDAKATSNTPEWNARRMEWVSSVLGGVRKSPFSKVKTLVADITADEARAKGYVKGNQKVEEVFGLLKRVTGPATIYKKQKLDRDDIIDITDMDVVSWLKGEMRLMIEEEIARAILVGDGRSNLSEDKIKDPAGSTDGTGIRSVLLDDDLYSVKYALAANVSPKDAVKGLVRARVKYRGTGQPTLFISDNMLVDILLEEDKFGRPLYNTKRELADKLRVRDIIEVEVFDEHPTLMAIMVSLVDYTVGSTRGGELTSFEDFDIDFNQYKYLLETRLSGGLTKPFSAVVVTRAQGTLATPEAPSFDGTTDTITIPTVTGVSYFDTSDDSELTGDVVITESTEVEARPDEGYYFAPNTTTTWTYAP